MKKFIQINPSDNVVVCLDAIQAHQQLDVDGVMITVAEDVERGSKVAIRSISRGDNIIKYGSPIGGATADIEAGQWVHTHNMKTNLSDTDSYQYHPKFVPVPLLSTQERTFQGYARANGDVAIRNEIWVIPTVGCVNGIARQAVERFKQNHPQLQCDGVHLFAHNYGCSQLGDDHENTRRILANMVKHPNAGGVLVIGLGCENNQIVPFQELVGDVDPDRVRYMVAQNERDEVAAAVEQLTQIYQTVRQDTRTEMSIGRLRVGLECGGSDGLSGITANPMLGAFSDYLIQFGGTSVLTEVPEMFGAEHILFERCIDEATFDKAVAMINGFKQYFIAHDQPIYENPSPGNKKGGISSLEDKSMGCTQKAGNSPVIDVLAYGDTLSVPGLNLLSAPGNDAVATSALAASGCHMVLFSTGRGTPYGGFVPTMKIATNSELAEKKPHWIDFNAGSLVEGVTMPEILDQFIERVVAIASGEPANNEKNDFRELAIFKSGVTL
ncbi:UxaA family hydrolase [Vibrio rhizosphaerae]|uniref:Altronate dehydratase family protein n=1 Tax=Vibrio rhizosphaerae TaxID=398736 RepID=A0ABU4ITC6_9VIBR|nr:altronate dehydratase family protein [Vibrio rhizosphaerae]MDW6092198.1 altronate dehydratase family protein [Vibrio rhizosphaerae]